MTVFFTSDTHFGDHRVLNLYPRPFQTVAEMNAALIERWNATIAETDTVWHLGDFARTLAAAVDVFPRLKGRKHLLVGNNDPPDVQTMGWETVGSYGELREDGVDLVLCHYPFRSWNGMHRGSVNLHGHSHGRLKPLPRQIDVGVDVQAFRPKSLPELLAKPERQRSSRNRSAHP